MTTKPEDRERDAVRRPHRVRLPGFVRDEDIGLGDVVTKSTSALGLKPCGGCAQRAGALNRWVVFGRGPSQRGN